MLLRLKVIVMMKILKNFKIKINKANVLKYMGYKNPEDVSSAVEADVDAQIEAVQGLLEPALIYEEYPIKVDEDWQKVYISDGKAWESRFVSTYMKGCDTMIVLVSTIGPKLPEEINKAFAQWDYLRAMALDSIADNAIDNMNKQFWVKLVNRVKKEGKGITGMLSPGHSDWNIEQQKLLFELVDASAIGVSLTDSCLMMPIKSISGIYGIGKDIPISKSSHNCDMCPIKGCFMREVG